MAVEQQLFCDGRTLVESR